VFIVKWRFSRCSFAHASKLDFRNQVRNAGCT
jgi:hypothetical protein